MTMMLYPPSWYCECADYYAQEPPECPRCGFPTEAAMVDGLCSTCDDDLAGE